MVKFKWTLFHPENNICCLGSLQVTTKMCGNALQQDVRPDKSRLHTEACPPQNDAESTVAAEIVWFLKTCRFLAAFTTMKETQILNTALPHSPGSTI